MGNKNSRNKNIIIQNTMLNDFHKKEKEYICYYKFKTEIIDILKEMKKIDEINNEEIILIIDDYYYNQNENYNMELRKIISEEDCIQYYIQSMK